VSTVRDGNNYMVRRIDVWQGLERSKICFTALCSFKKPSGKFLEIQPARRDLVKEYSGIMDGKKIEDLPLITNFKDLRAAYDQQATCFSMIFPGMITSILPFEKMHHTKKPLARKNLYIYAGLSIKDFKDPSIKVVETEAEEDDDLALMAAAHLYHSDRESVWSVLRQYELLDILNGAASLSHTVTFHGDPHDLRLWEPKTRRKRWFYMESASERVSDGRVLHQAKLYDEDGKHVATTLQDGAIRLSFGSEEERLKRQAYLNGEGGPKL
jgi:acyl-CoA thioesterase